MYYIRRWYVLRSSGTCHGPCSTWRPVTARETQERSAGTYEPHACFAFALSWEGPGGPRRTPTATNAQAPGEVISFLNGRHRGVCSPGRAQQRSLPSASVSPNRAPPWNIRPVLNFVDGASHGYRIRHGASLRFSSLVEITPPALRDAAATVCAPARVLGHTNPAQRHSMTPFWTRLPHTFAGIAVCGRSAIYMAETLGPSPVGLGGAGGLRLLQQRALRGAMAIAREVRWLSEIHRHAIGHDSVAIP
ncbi:hypothetical protein AcW1_003879 [Taiwanofungus camphoratus]|nr:hypothetical protein AcW1_003879 [Antrodia cinnamomea]